MPTKAEYQLIDRVAFAARLTQGQARDAINAIGAAIVREVQEGHAVEIANFGLFDRGTRPSDGTPALRFRQHKLVRQALRQTR